MQAQVPVGPLQAAAAEASRLSLPGAQTAAPVGPLQAAVAELWVQEAVPVGPLPAAASEASGPEQQAQELAVPVEPSRASEQQVLETASLLAGLPAGQGALPAAAIQVEVARVVALPVGSQAAAFSLNPYLDRKERPP